MKNISLFTLLEIALKHIFIIIAAALVVAIGTFCYCEFVAVPQYSATGSIVVTNGGIISENDWQGDDYTDDSNLNNTDIQASISFSKIITEILNKNNVFKLLSEKLDGRYSYSQLKSFARIERTDTSSILIDVTFTANTREDAIELTNTYLEIAPEYIVSKFPQANVHDIFIADSAGKIFPRTLLTTAAGGVVGAVIAYAVLFLIYCANTVIKGEDDFKDRFELPVLGCIPDFATAKSEKYYKKYNYNSKGGKKNHGK